MKCCICGSGIAEGEHMVLFSGAKAEENIICTACEEKFKALLRGENTDVYCKFLLEKVNWGMANEEAGNYLKAVLDYNGHVDVDRIKQNMKKIKVEKTMKVRESGWVALLRLVAWIEIVGGCIASLIFGIILGQESGALGVAVTLVGAITSFVLSAAIMVFLGMASDIHAIRQYVKK